MTAKRHADPGLPNQRHAAGAYEIHVVSGATGIGDNDVRAGLGFVAEILAGDRRERRPGVNDVDRRFGNLNCVDHATLRCQHEKPAAKARRFHPRCQTAEIDRHQRLQRGVDRSRRRPAIFAQSRIERVRQSHRDVRQLLLKDIADAPLVR